MANKNISSLAQRIYTGIILLLIVLFYFTFVILQKINRDSWNTDSLALIFKLFNLFFIAGIYYIATRELLSCMVKNVNKKKMICTSVILSVIFLLLQTAWIICQTFGYIEIFQNTKYDLLIFIGSFLIIFIIQAAFTFLRYKKYIANPILFIFTSILISIVFAFILFLSYEGNWMALILMLLAACVSDIGGLMFGVSFGKHKIAPIISPKKTWEGAIGGWILSTLVFLIVCILLMFDKKTAQDIFIIDFNNLRGISDYGLITIFGILFGVVLSVVSFFGDIYFSYLKRISGIKDYSNLLPGHGGILDRFDSITAVFCVYMVYMVIISPIIN